MYVAVSLTMVKGDLVRQIEGHLLGDKFFEPKVKPDYTQVGVVIDTRHKSSWLSGYGPIDEWYALVSWSSGNVKWISLDCLTNYGL